MGEKRTTFQVPQDANVIARKLAIALSVQRGVLLTRSEIMREALAMGLAIMAKESGVES